jgi:hypothetical protein
LDYGGETFTELEDIATTGLVTVAFDSYFDANDTVYAALYGTGIDNGIYRWVIGESDAWKDLDAESYDYTGLVLDNADGNPMTGADTGGILYASYVTQIGGDIATGVARCLTPAEDLCCEETEWDYLHEGLTPDTEAFYMLPKALKICGCLTADSNSKLFAIDGLGIYDMARGRDGTIWKFTTHDVCQILTTELSDGQVGVAYEASLEASGGTEPYNWAIIDGALPDGLGLSANSGVISGTPTQAGAFNFTVQVTDDGGLTATRVLSITVGDWDPWAYDEDNSGYIEIGELLQAINDYISGDITISQLLEIINLYINHTHK